MEISPKSLNKRDGFFLHNVVKLFLPFIKVREIGFGYSRFNYTRRIWGIFPQGAWTLTHASEPLMLQREMLRKAMGLARVVGPARAPLASVPGELGEPQESLWAGSGSESTRPCLTFSVTLGSIFWVK